MSTKLVLTGYHSCQSVTFSFVILLILVLRFLPRMKKLSRNWQWVLGLNQSLLSQSKTLLRWFLMWRAWRKLWWNLRWLRACMCLNYNFHFSLYHTCTAWSKFFAIQDASYFAEVTASFRSALNKVKSLTKVWQAVEVVTYLWCTWECSLFYSGECLYQSPSELHQTIDFVVVLFLICCNDTLFSSFLLSFNF